MSKFSIEEFNKSILSMMERDGLRWSKQWFNVADGLPMNAETRRMYSGMNIYILLGNAISKGFTSDQWGTLKTWNRLGYSVKPKPEGCTDYGTTIYNYQFFSNIDKETEKRTSGRRVFMFTVFNADQVWSAQDHSAFVNPDADKPKMYQTMGSDAVEQIITRMGVIMKYGGNQPAYSPTSDCVKMPFLEQYNGNTLHFDTDRMHEIGHWTGHDSRMNRGIFSHFGTEQYAKEELVAELISTAMSKIMGFENIPMESHAAYLKGWMAKIRDEKNYFRQASDMAWKAIRYICEGGGIDVDFGGKEKEEEIS